MEENEIFLFFEERGRKRMEKSSGLYLVWSQEKDANVGISYPPMQPFAENVLAAADAMSIAIILLFKRGVQQTEIRKRSNSCSSSSPVYCETKCMYDHSTCLMRYCTSVFEKKQARRFFALSCALLSFLFPSFI